MKKIIFLLISTSTFAQFGIFGKDPIINKENFDKQRVHWGYYLGASVLDFKVDYLGLKQEEINVESTTGFNVGLISNLRITEHLDLRFEPGLYITQRNLTFPNIIEQKDRLREVKSTYIYFPLLAKFSATRTGNIKPYLIGGYATALNLSSNETAPVDNYEGRFRMTKWNNFIEIGFGIDLYFEYFKFSPSIRGVFGLNDELIRDNNPSSPWTSDVQQMKTRGIFINFAFH
ncbi:porin family protein [Flavobacterium sp.]|uniref:type IX secretion/gliding motility protein PorT/SprT n=1 Tax=Flavobacterium sp. TaxID=239 RepID=UPI003528BC97